MASLPGSSGPSGSPAPEAPAARHQPQKRSHSNFKEVLNPEPGTGFLRLLGAARPAVVIGNTGAFRVP
eukprot:886914-Alexandrium_andersonii.AAC.1